MISALCVTVITLCVVCQGNECYVYTDLTSAKPSRSTGIDYSVYSRPIDLSKGPMNRRPSQRGDIGLASLTAPPGLPHRVYPVPLTLQFSGGRGGQPAKCSRKPPKRLRDGDDQQSQTKKPGKPNTNKSTISLRNLGNDLSLH